MNKRPSKNIIESENQLDHYCNRQTSVLNASYLKESSTLKVQCLVVLIRIISGSCTKCWQRKRKVAINFPEPKSESVSKKAFPSQQWLQNPSKNLQKGRKKEEQKEVQYCTRH